MLLAIFSLRLGCRNHRTETPLWQELEAKSFFVWVHLVF